MHVHGTISCLNANSRTSSGQRKRVLQERRLLEGAALLLRDRYFEPPPRSLRRPRSAMHLYQIELVCSAGCRSVSRALDAAVEYTHGLKEVLPTAASLNRVVCGQITVTLCAGPGQLGVAQQPVGCFSQAKQGGSELDSHAWKKRLAPASHPGLVS